MLADALEHLVRGIVTNPDDVDVRDKDLRRGRMLEVRVNPDDIGKVIGRSGRTATALRTVIGALAGRDQVRVDFVDVDQHARRGNGGGRRRPAVGADGRGRWTATEMADDPCEVVRRRASAAPTASRGEVAVELRTDEPERRFAAGQRLRVRGLGPHASPWSPPGTTPVGCWCASPRLAGPHRRRGAARTPRWSSTSTADERPDEPEEFYDRQLVGLAGPDADGTEVGRVAAVLHLPEQDLLEIATDGGRPAGAVRAGAGARGRSRRRRRPARRRTRAADRPRRTTT